MDNVKRRVLHADAELFLYAGDQHCFAGSSLPPYDAHATALTGSPSASSEPAEGQARLDRTMWAAFSDGTYSVTS